MNLKVEGGHPSFRNALDSRYFQGEGKFGTKGGSLGYSQMPILGDKWQMGLQRQHIPKAPQNHRFIIPTRCLEDNRKHIRDHSFICKFIGIWSTKKELERWIQWNW